MSSDLIVNLPFCLTGTPTSRGQLQKAAEHSRSAAPRRGFKNRLCMNVPRPGLYRLALANPGRESKMLFHQRNQTDVAARTQQPSASYLGKLVAMYVMMVIASSTAPNQSHCCWALGSSLFISPSVQSNTRSKDSGSRAIRSLPLSKRIKESLCRRALFPTLHALP